YAFNVTFRYEVNLLPCNLLIGAHFVPHSFVQRGHVVLELLPLGAGRDLSVVGLGWTTLRRRGEVLAIAVVSVARCESMPNYRGSGGRDKLNFKSSALARLGIWGLARRRVRRTRVDRVECPR